MGGEGSELFILKKMGWVGGFSPKKGEVGKIVEGGY